MSNKIKSERQRERERAVGNKPVTRSEFVEVLEQLTNNMSEMSKYLTSDINVMFQKYVYPVMMKQQAIMELLIEKGVLTQEEIITRADKIIKEAVDSAKEIDESGNVVIEEDTPPEVEDTSGEENTPNDEEPQS